MARVAVVATGGTIGSKMGPEGRNVGASAQELVDAAGAVWDLSGIEIVTREPLRIISFAATIPLILDLARTVNELADDVDGIVITHGTDTLEETAMLLALSYRGSAPVTVTGAQRPFDDPACDGMRNLGSAIRWVASREAAGSGVTVTFADKVIPAIGARKINSFGLAAFDAPARGPIAWVDEVGIRRIAAAAVPTAIIAPETTDLPRVDLVPQYLGADDWAVRAARESGAVGIVFEGFGAGDLTPPTSAACREWLDDGGYVVSASRTGTGPVRGLYVGGALDLEPHGLLYAGDLSPWQARLVLAAVLSTTDDRETAIDRYRGWFTAAGAIAGH